MKWQRDDLKKVRLRANFFLDGEDPEYIQDHSAVNVPGLTRSITGWKDRATGKYRNHVVYRFNGDEATSIDGLLALLTKHDAEIVEPPK